MWIDDSLLEKSRESLSISVWSPREPMVVLGSSNDPTLECNLAECQSNGVPVLRRYGGGGTVLLYDGCVVVSAGIWVSQHFQNGHYFKLCNQSVIDALAVGCKEFEKLGQSGISDIVWTESQGSKLKVAGTSLFRSRNYLLYQASIIVALDVDAINRYLKHPTKEPEYRGGRSHADFLKGLANIHPSTNVGGVVRGLEENLKNTITKNFGIELIQPCDDQFSALDARLQRAKVDSVNFLTLT